ncbi:hypothetical protein CHH28_11665 [Bacterioplanes sanyensis]|uniref:DUF2947 domain-containing protein n=1 Tax=Bacterioplanes sanyensis TaxID=1249553 RepID=A0A222FQZ6_9GAMM|nr:DUF2947 domain-containing protein [Bacterioplanes sanyensis]ASP40916.1 hypothetical protein CHH28_11665 [Bacterioplanes sanyensis]
MQYLDWPDYRQGWIFRHRELPVPDSAMARIRPLAASSASQWWRQQVSLEASHASHFLSDDWPARNGVWQTERLPWQARWESDDHALPDEILNHFQWQDNTVVYFCYDVHHVVETDWLTFKQHWKNFLFFDDGPLLMGRRRNEVAQFFSDGDYVLGNKPS